MADPALRHPTTLHALITGSMEALLNSYSPGLPGDGELSVNIKPLSDRIVVRRVEEKENRESGIITPDSAKEKPQQGEVISVGEGTRTRAGKLLTPDVKAGDRVLFGKYSGSEIRLQEGEFVILREEDILGVFERGAEMLSLPGDDPTLPKG